MTVFKTSNLRNALFLTLAMVSACGEQVTRVGGEWGALKDSIFSVQKKFQSRARLDVLESIDRPTVRRKVENILSSSRSDGRLVSLFETKTAPKQLSYSISLDGMRVCASTVQAREVNSLYYVMSSMPEESSAKPVDKVEFAKEDAFTNLAMHLGINVESLGVVSADSCLVETESEFVTAWEILFYNHGVPAVARVSHKDVLELSDRAFEVTGSARVYKYNPEDGELFDFELTGLTGEGILENESFTVSVAGTVASAANHVFEFDPDDTRFDQASVFAHANEQREWFIEHGYEPAASNKVNLQVHAVVNGSVNNALYTPAFGKTAPKIEVGDGDGIRLQNLPKDGDVVSHEFGHHVVFDTLTETTNEPLVMHEGLADFFSFAQTGDPCLGESICPANSPVNCERPAQCLRNADNDYVLDKNTKSEAHFKSQFLSGMLWDLRDNEIPAEDLVKITMGGVKLLLNSSGYHDLVLAMMISDKELYDGEYCSAIFAKAEDRGLSNYINDISCDNIPSAASLNNSGGTTLTKTESKKKSGFGLVGCGVVAGRDQIPATWYDILSSFIMLAVLLLPTLIIHVRSTIAKS